MEIENDILHEFSEGKQVSKNKIFVILAVLFSINLFFSTLLIYSSLKIANLSASALIFRKALFFTILIQRAIPTIALLLLLFKTKLGWILGVIVTVNELISKGAFIFRMLLNFDLFSNSTNGVVISYSLTCVVCTVIICLLYSNSITSKFKIGKNIKWFVIAIALLLFLATQYYISHFILRP